MHSKTQNVCIYIHISILIWGDCYGYLSSFGYYFGYPNGSLYGAQGILNRSALESQHVVGGQITGTHVVIVEEKEKRSSLHL